MTDKEVISPAGYPAAILKGDVVGVAFEGVRQRLKALFPEDIFKHAILPPHASRKTWDAIIKDAPCVAIGIGGWRENGKSSNTFIGDLAFPLAVIQTLQSPDDLYAGTTNLRDIGVAGIMAAIAGALNAWTLDGVGSCRVRAITLPGTEDWFEDRSALVAVELVFEGVKLDNREALAELEDFVAGRTAVKMKKESGDE